MDRLDRPRISRRRCGRRLRRGGGLRLGAAMDLRRLSRRADRPSDPAPRPQGRQPRVRRPRRTALAPLLLIGALAGFSSGFMGIGGGLAITVGLAAGLRVPQHQAQLVSLIFSVIPTNIPAAWIYWSKGLMVGWPAIVGILAGLWIGTDLGARAANGVSKAVLHRVMIALISVMAL
nr:sulfite exporter TauE/SafE family protein [Bradyrhizobium liaoningense]